MSIREDLAARGMPDEWLEFFERLRVRLDRVIADPPPATMPPDGRPRMALAVDDVVVLAAQAEEGVIAGARADAAIQRALASAARSEERIKEFMRKEAGLQQQVDDAHVAAMERACAAVCERCAKYGPATWSTRCALHPPGHPEHGPDDGQWWHDDTPGDIPGDGWCSAQQIRKAFGQPRRCQRAPDVDCGCEECVRAAQRLQEQGPHGPGSCRECGGYNVRWDLGPAWRVDCVDCGNGGDLPRQIPAP